LVELGERGVEVGRVSEFQRVAVHLVGAGNLPEAAEGVIVGGARGRVQTNGLAGAVGATADRRHGSYHLVGHVADVGQVLGRNVLLVCAVSNRATLAVVGAVEEVHGGASCLVVIIAPAVQ